VVVADVGQHGHLGIDHVGGVVPTEHAHLDHRHVDGDVGEVGERRGREDLEVAGGDPGQVLDRRHRADGRRQGLVADRFAVPGDALVDGLEVRARVGAHRQAGARRSSVHMRATDPLPLVPVMWITG
jgi:hypothetical protein